MLQAAERDAEDLLARIDDQLLPIVSILADSSSVREDFVHAYQNRLPIAKNLIDELSKKLDSDERVALELRSICARSAAAQNQFLEAERTLQLRISEMDDQQRLINSIDEQINAVETMLANLSTNEMHPQPLDVAVQDRNILALLREQLNSIDLAAVRNDDNRNALQKRVKILLERVEVS
jgi:hypothetical protein